MTKRFSRLAVVALSCFYFLPLDATAEGLSGNWISQDHSVIRIYECEAHSLCARVIKTTDPQAIDDLNPDVKLKGRKVCGLQLGRGFERVGDNRAKNGRFYDPNSGKTYTAEMALLGSQLKVRGYVGVPLFGRTETWNRASDDIIACKDQP